MLHTDSINGKSPFYSVKDDQLIFYAPENIVIEKETQTYSLNTGLLMKREWLQKRFVQNEKLLTYSIGITLSSDAIKLGLFLPAGMKIIHLRVLRDLRIFLDVSHFGVKDILLPKDTPLGYIHFFQSINTEAHGGFLGGSLLAFDECAHGQEMPDINDTPFEAGVINEQEELFRH